MLSTHSVPARFSTEHHLGRGCSGRVAQNSAPNGAKELSPGRKRGAVLGRVGNRFRVPSGTAQYSDVPEGGITFGIYEKLCVLCVSVVK